MMHEVRRISRLTPSAGRSLVARGFRDSNRRSVGTALLRTPIPANFRVADDTDRILASHTQASRLRSLPHERLRPKQISQRKLGVLAMARAGQVVFDKFPESESLLQFADQSQATVGGDPRTLEINLQRGVEGELRRYDGPCRKFVRGECAPRLLWRRK